MGNSGARGGGRFVMEYGSNMLRFYIHAILSLYSWTYFDNIHCIFSIFCGRASLGEYAEYDTNMPEYEFSNIFEFWTGGVFILNMREKRAKYSIFEDF